MFFLKILCRVRAFTKGMAKELWHFSRMLCKVHVVSFAFSSSDDHLMWETCLHPAPSDCGSYNASSDTPKLCKRIILQHFGLPVWNSSWKLIL